MVDLFDLGTMLRCPGGNVETVPAQKAAGVRWATVNVGSDPCVRRDPSVWTRQRQLYREAGVPHGPWMHVRSMEDLAFLVRLARDEWRSDLVGPNIENVVRDGLDLREVGAYLLREWVVPTGKPVHLPTLPWVQNGQGWGALDFCTFALEMFPLEGDGQLYLDEWERCVDHAFREGAKKVTLLFSTTSPRSVYPNVAHVLYTADNVTSWPEWHDVVPQQIPRPPAPPPPPEASMLTEKQFPYTGPLYGPDNPKGPTLNRETNKALKRAMKRLRYLSGALGGETDDFGPELEEAMRAWWREEGGTGPFTGYGRGAWLALRSQRISVGPNAGKFAMDALALSQVREDALVRVYPHPFGSLSEICQGPHPTAGLVGNIAQDFCAPGGTKVLASESGTIRKLSGRDPRDGADQRLGIFGWSIHWETSDGYRYFDTHFGSRSPLAVGQRINAGQVLGTVGHWPGDPSRSHLHRGVTSPLGIVDAKKRITEVGNAPRIAA